ncbi:MAG: nucleotidyl transferase AbiEii/AbiGii toxin family protein, partial [Candidatus Hydrogenedentes bacterium]|nr:nucleotidyl transferase AbiEii/AbiGii toxin family protein [Candidatus Hydrogenedentota bacterium]
NELLQYYVIERFIYRLSKRDCADRFILKGALLLSAWNMPMSRPTKDIDLLGKIGNNQETIVAAVKAICGQDVVADGLTFDAKSVTATRITEGAEYKGLRVRFQGSLGNARTPLQVDIGFGDVVSPGPCRISYPTLLDFPSPSMSGYSMESVSAEKFQAMVKLGVLNSRMKDFYDIWALSRAFDFSGVTLATAISATFDARNTSLPDEPTVFQESFALDTGKEIQWQAFLKRNNLGYSSTSFVEVAAAIKEFLKPIVSAITGGRTAKLVWIAPGPWRSREEGANKE